MTVLKQCEYLWRVYLRIAAPWHFPCVNVWWLHYMARHMQPWRYRIGFESSFLLSTHHILLLPVNSTHIRHQEINCGTSTTSLCINYTQKLTLLSLPALVTLSGHSCCPLWSSGSAWLGRCELCDGDKTAMNVNNQRTMFLANGP